MIVTASTKMLESIDGENVCLLELRNGDRRLHGT